MKNKNTYTENLSEMLGEIDYSIIEEAYLVDDAEKLKKLKRDELSIKKKNFISLTVFYRVATAAVCFILVVGLVSAMFWWKKESNRPDGDKEPSVSLPSLDNDTDNENDKSDTDNTEDSSKNPDTDNSDNSNEPDEPDKSDSEDYIIIDSIDKMNYYVAKKILFEKESDTLSNKCGITQLSSESGDYNRKYPIDPDKEIVVSEVIFFQIELTNEDGFLASRLGMGTVDVVIMKNNLYLGYIVTFKNGDAFYSCLRTGGSPTRWDFSTHNYIEGFYCIKKFDQTNFKFIFTLNNGYITDMNCEYFKSAPMAGEPVPDEASVVTDSCIFADVDYSFTLAGLEEYVNSNINSNKENNVSNFYCTYQQVYEKKKIF